MQKNEFVPLLHTIYKSVNLKWIRNLSVRTKTTKGKQKGKFSQSWIKQQFLRYDSKKHK